MNVIAQIPSSCGGLPTGNVGFKVAVQNECGTYLLGLPLTVQNINTADYAKGLYLYQIHLSGIETIGKLVKE